MIRQNFIYKTDENEFEFNISSFDGEKKCYILRDYAESEIPAGGKFYAVWDLKTDSKGRITMPYMSSFMKGETVDFECFADESKGSVSIEINGKEQSAETLYAKINLKKLPKSRRKKKKEEKPEQTEKIKEEKSESAEDAKSTENTENKEKTEE